jgi:hypothetical protein
LSSLHRPREHALAIAPLGALVEKRRESHCQLEDLIRAIALARVGHRREIFLPTILEGIERGALTFEIRRH